MTRQRQLVLTTVGISLFLKSLSPEEREEGGEKRLNRHANATELPPDLEAFLAELVARAEQTLTEGTVAAKRLVSAELNGLYGLYEDQLQRARNDVHVLVATDTVLGCRAAQTLEAFLRSQGITNVQMWVPEQLSSGDNRRFSHGIKELLRWCEETIPEYRADGYRIVFNLTGAFKSLQSYLNIAGMFYADEIVYIFESSKQLLRIPRLPIQVDIAPLQTYCTQLALLDAGAILPHGEVANLPEGLLDIDQHGDVTLSEWGRLIWNRVRHELLQKELLPFPNLVYEESFRRDFDRAAPEERVDLQRTLARVSVLLNEGGVVRLKQDGGLQYEDYQNRRSVDGRPIGHFRLTQGRRVSCVAEGERLRLRHFGAHDRVNDNP
ncbi:putative CRISPR-associated protein [Caldilinea sp.]|uniref:putative CRISPR-associated protein n=1 Tax=Caldilinea sp. TaxID=2293560 RepID=UPI0026125E6B|nr:putative CRISPR-associated protein [uncultured Caldilinea sp.]